MKSTGEVLGVARDFEDALFKAITATGVRMPQPGSGVLITVRDTDKEEILPIARYFFENRYKLYATRGTCAHLVENGMEATRVHAIDEGSPNVLDILTEGVGLVINTPTRGRKRSATASRSAAAPWS